MTRATALLAVLLVCGPAAAAGDFTIEGQNFTFYFPLATGLLISVLFSLVLWFLQR